MLERIDVDPKRSNKLLRCQDKLQNSHFVMCSDGVSGPTSMSQSFLRAAPTMSALQEKAVT